MAKKNQYDASSVKVLEYPENVRTKYGMYIGDSDENGVRQCWGEVVGNCLDEASAGHNKRIYVEILKDNEFIIADAGRGIPVEKHKATKISTLTTVLTKLHAGAKIETNNKTYKASYGTFGVGVSVTNALAEYLEVWTYRDGWHYQRFERGIVVSGEPKKVKKPPVFHYKKQGTVIRFKSDKKIFGKSVFPADKALEWLETISYFYSDVKFTTVYKSKEKTFQQKGVFDLSDRIIKENSLTPMGKPFFYKDDNVAVLLQWTDGDEDHLTSYVNGFKTTSGVHLDALNKIVSTVFSAFKLKRQDFKPENLRVGLVGVLNVTISAPLFASQTKERLLSKEGADAVLSSNTPFTKWAAQNKATIKDIINRAVELNKLEDEFKAKKKLAASTKTTVKGKILMPPNFLEAKTRHRKDVELFLVEGDSAKGSARLARDAMTQAILPLKGKIINAINAKDDKIAANNEIVSILKAIGYNPNLKDPYDKLRMGKLIFLSDADPDGYHIALLYSAVVFKLLRPLYKKKMVYFVKLPLYTCTHKDKRYFGDTLEELKEQVPNLNPERVTRMKGLGEVDPDVLNTIAFNHKTRKLIRIKLKEGKRLSRYVATLHSENSFRKDILGIQPRVD